MMHTADGYRSEWATLTGRSESEIYVPVALREPKAAGGDLTAERGAGDTGAPTH